MSRSVLGALQPGAPAVPAPTSSTAKQPMGSADEAARRKAAHAAGREDENDEVGGGGPTLGATS
jgi:hypothetical protein